MKTLPFDLSKAMDGHPLVTRGGEEAKFITFIRYNSGDMIVPLVREDKESIENFVKENGFVLMSDIHEIPLGEQ